MSNYYGILGVTKNANEKDIRSAYRKLARKYHPDLNPGSKESADKFKKVKFVRLPIVDGISPLHSSVSLQWIIQFSGGYQP